MSRSEKHHIAVIDFPEFYSSCFSDLKEAEEFYSRLRDASPAINDPLVIVHQAGRMVWLADRIDEVAAGRPAFQILFYVIAAELVAKTASKYEGEGRSKEFVRKFFEDLCTEEARERLAKAFKEGYWGTNLSLRRAVDFLYGVRCDVAHRGQYYTLSLPRQDDTDDVLVVGAENSLITDLRIAELRQIILEGAVRTARVLLETRSKFSPQP